MIHFHALRPPAVPARPTAPVLRFFALCMIVVLVCVRLGSFSDEVFVDPVEDAIFDVAFIDGGDETQPRPPLLMHKGVFDCDLPGQVVALRAPLPAPSTSWACIPALCPREAALEIFIPPEAAA